MLKVTEIKTDLATYKKLVAEKGSVFNTSAWLALYGTKVRVWGVFEKDKLLASFYTFTYKKSFIKFTIPPPFCPDAALVISDSTDIAEVQNCLKSWLDKAYRTSDFFSFSLSYEFADLLKLKINDKLQFKKRHTYILDLSKTGDVQQLYDPKRRQQIRRAVRDGLEVKQIKDFSLVYEMVAKTYARQQKHFDNKFVRKILSEFATNKNSFAFGSFINGQCSVAYFCVWYKNKCYYLMGGYDEDLKHIGAGPFAMNACIEHAKKLGVEIFDFEGSMEPAIERYFKEFGGTRMIYPSWESSSALGRASLQVKKMIGK